MGNTAITSDWHMGHAKILTLGKGRPFATVEEMNDAIIDRCNEVCREGDTLIHLGDFCCGVAPTPKGDYWKSIRRRLRAGTVIGFRGNHDPKLPREGVDAFALLFDEFYDLQILKLGGRDYVCCHYPLEHWAFEATGVRHLFGHQHGLGKRHPTRLKLDVGVDGHDYRPWSLEEIEVEMMSKGWEAASHHA